MIANRMMRIEVPPPPDNVPDPQPPAANLSTRERYVDHEKNACATACHSVFDPLGFAFEGYDAIGGFRATDGGKPVNATGTLQLDGKDRPFKDAIEMVALLAQSNEVRECMARQWMRYALRRRELPGESASLASMRVDFEKAGFDMRELIVAMTKTRAFALRTPLAGEGLPGRTGTG